jgi:adenosine/AMP kinase
MATPKFFTIKIQKPDDDFTVNIIIGQTHFIKSVEDIHEALMNSVPGIKFGLAFCEASGPKLIRYSSTDKDMEALAVQNAKKIKAGHIFVIFLKNTFPVNVLNAIKQVPEVCRIFCATANPLKVVIAESKSGRGVIGVIDGKSSSRIETKKDKQERYELLREIGYKF